MAQAAAGVLAEGIISRGVDTVFGIPGDRIAGPCDGGRSAPILFRDRPGELL